MTSDTIASGTNCDDLSDFRPGLRAAQEHDVVHPYVEAGATKRDIYELAQSLGLSDIARLPRSLALQAGSRRALRSTRATSRSWTT